MPLNASLLASEIKAQLLTLSYVIDDDKLNDFTDKIAQAIVSHITANAVVQTTVGAPDGEHMGIIL